MSKIHLQNRCHEHNPPRPPKNLPDLALGAPLALFWEGSGGSWAHLGLSWAPVGSSWVHLGASWVPLGRLLGVPGALLAVSGAPLGPLARLLGDLGFTLKGFRKGLGGFGGRSGPQNNCSFVFQRTSPLNIKSSFPLHPKCRTTSFPAFGLQSASAGCAERKQYARVS